ncbi:MULTISPECIES: NifU family protein [Chlamydia]|uniref:Nitrogen fixation protein NifU n=1 Tax=Chlamydophila parapsittaci TaxID=344886 RepID=A0ABX5VWY0_9CHLA|nr:MULTISPECIES: NifU family protein [Chlamydia]AFS23168.1 nifU-like domain protein [Chlamydia psittaci VS225]AGE75482.1 putative NifU-related protein [Chlamydia psittaci Mat116]EPP31100.1 nifU-like N terminal domain protein [Chlamydia psittaci C1/97]AFS21036.1 nifU-like domain protein [Chlamydia psittaci GR9]AFS24051.1 nifU-like domain protein [Chlamydia psittaci WS/RT/E30]
MTIPFQPVASWANVSPKVMKKFHKFYCEGTFSAEDAESKGAHLIIGSQGHRLMGNYVIFYWLIDKVNGKIIDAKFQYFGHPFLLVLAETTCNLVTGKTYAQAYNLTVNSIDIELRSHPDKPALPENSSSLYHCIIDALDIAAEQCMEIPLEDGSLPLKESFLPSEIEDANPYTKEAWEALSIESRLHALRTITEDKISPYVALDGGSVLIEKLEENVVTIAYAGNCSGCFSAIGSTLNSIGQLLRAYVYSELQIKVNEASLDFSMSQYSDETN